MELCLIPRDYPYTLLWGDSSTDGSGEGETPTQDLLPECYYSRISQGEVKVALQKMGKNKAVGPNQIPIEAWRCLGYEGLKRFTSLFNKIFSSTKMLEEWRLRRSSIEAIHLLGSLLEKYKERHRDLHMAFLDLEKAYDSVPRELIWRTMIDKRTPMTYLKFIKDMYEWAKTRVRSTVGIKDVDGK
ncbi:hypothetical protein CTI12_AA063330 [Artemisia annua]|uniref:Reverse transcriptase domain-containing protein n=1 Tax=Artemisia annua TaxID=35608 RepID=A0A2U1P0C2_ARTAN|nr:hypothetical protein CTI12_AA063330 [Artemisia annua]